MATTARIDAAAVDRPALEAALREAIDGEARFDAQSQALYATDASNYRETPLGVVLPRSAEDVVAAVACCRRFGAPITSRGGGTSLAGQACNTAVIFDFSKYLNRVLEIDPEARTAWVEPGCVLDDLRAAAAPHGLTFGPDPSTHNHCTLGGMVGNNSCGVHSVMAGRTSDNVEALEILTYDGERMTVGPTSPDELERIIAEGGRHGAIYAALRDLCDRCGDEIRARSPDIPRKVSGFNLAQLLPENDFHVARALVGSEGGCVIVLRIKVRLVPARPERVLLVLGYPDACAAADAVPEVLEAGPVGLEGIDETLTGFMRRKHLREEQLSLLPEGEGWLLVEFGADTQEEAEAQARALMERLAERTEISMRLICAPETQEKLWAVREAGLPATAHVPGMLEAHPGWEDSSVPPDRVGDYLRDFKALLKEFGYHASVYGHFGDGCLHCRIDFDFSTRSHVADYLRFIDRAADLVVSYGGSLSGEHGDGQARGVLLDKMFGADLVRAFQDFKAIWDPDGGLNPGKMPAPDPPDAHLREGPEFAPVTLPSRLALREDGGDFIHAANRCVGVGACRKRTSGVMCPSYRATMEETHSTRGRARLLFEMVDGKVVGDRWRSKAVHDALDLCLACKACKSECPVRVDMATYKAEFMHHHYAGRLRPRSAYSMGLIRAWSRLASKLPRLANALSHAPLSAPALKWGAGIAPERELPLFAQQDFRSWFAARTPRKPQDGARRVLLWADTFNTYFTPEPLKATTELLEAAGWQVEIAPRPVCCARPLYGFGMLDRAEKTLRQTLDVLRPWLQEGVPVVGLEPTCVVALQDELMEMLPNDRDARRLASSTQHLAAFLEQNGYEPPRIGGKMVLHFHCHHRAVLDTGPEIRLLRAADVDLEVLDDGCCGMAGDYGFRRESYAISQTLGEMDWLPAVRGAGEARVITDGFSCREQARQGTGRMPETLPEVLTGAGRGAEP
jgi:FAD/FMN-containing dehydrogenase/Fe-S oxidoreductase